MCVNGGRECSGVFQRIISLMPAHAIYVVTHLGDGNILPCKCPAVDCTPSKSILRRLQHSRQRTVASRRTSNTSMINPLHPILCIIEPVCRDNRDVGVGGGGISL